MTNLSIKTKITLIMIGMIIVSSALYTFNVIYSVEKISEQNIQRFQTEAYATKKQELLHYSQMALEVINAHYQRTKKEKIKDEVKLYIDEQSSYLFSILDGQYKRYKDTLSEAELKDLLKETVKSTRYGKSGYFWINDYEYKMVMHPIKEELTGGVFINTPKVPFVELAVDALKKNKQEKAYIQYSFYSPSAKEYMHKASIVKVFKPFNWIIGTGAYINDVSSQMKAQTLQAVKNLKYGDNGYFWINDMNNKMLMHPIKPEYDNKTFVDTPKVPFVELGVNQLRSSKKDSDFIEYSFLTPSTGKYSHKLSIVSKFQPWGWVIGTGAYTNYIEENIDALREQTKEQIHSIIFYNILMSLAILVVLTMFIIFLANSIIIKPIKKFQTGLQSFFDYLEDPSKEIEAIEVTTQDEIGEMSLSVNNSISVSIKLHDEIANLMKTMNKNVITSEVDNQGIISYVSEAFCSISGFSKEELIGKHYDTLRHPDMLQEVYNEMWDAIDNDKIWVGEVKNIKKDGGFYWVDMIVTPRCSKDGSNCGFTAIRYDITSKKEVEDLTANLELKIEERTADLEDAKKEIEASNRHTRDSIEYAALIQGALIPDEKSLAQYFKDDFVYWMPKDTVGGDIWLFNELRHKDECLLFFIDCTGHGVPGAFVTMIVKAIEREIAGKILKDDSIDVSPAWIMAYFNRTMKVLLKQTSSDAKSNAGWDGGIIYYNKRTQILKFAGAETPLFYIDENGDFKTIKGNRYSVGYKKCAMDYEYKESVIEVKEGMKFYCTTDGYLDQNGGAKSFPFGKKRFGNIIKEHHSKPMLKQKEIFLKEMFEYESMVENNDRNDDITLVSFEIDSKSSFVQILEIMKYEGTMTQNVIGACRDNIRLKIDNTIMRSHISTVVIELCQNMMYYAKNADKDSRQIVPAGSIEVLQDDESFYIIAKNIISVDDISRIESSIKDIKPLDKTGLRKRYRELRKSGENTHEKGAGIGLYEISKVVDSIEYSFDAINEDKYYFEQRVVIVPRKRKLKNTQD